MNFDLKSGADISTSMFFFTLPLRDNPTSQDTFDEKLHFQLS